MFYECHCQKLTERVILLRCAIDENVAVQMIEGKWFGVLFSPFFKLVMYSVWGFNYRVSVSFFMLTCLTESNDV